MLLPLAHEESTVRRVPWVSVLIVALCLGVQIYAELVAPGVEARAEELAREMAAVEAEAIAAHYAEKTLEERRSDELQVLERVAESGSELKRRRILFDAHQAPLERFRRGELTGPGSEEFQRYQELQSELDALKQAHPYLRLGYRPAHDGVLAMLSSAFTHGGWLHLLGNMWFLYLVGCNLEDRWGRWQFLLFYLTAGCIAALGFTMLHPEQDQPLIGASGAVAGAMGAFLVCLGRAKVKMLYVYLLLAMPRFGTFHAPAWVLLLLWLLEQLVMTQVEVVSGAAVAYSAHAAGFLFGACVAFALRSSGVDSQLDEASERLADAGNTAWTEHALYIRAVEHGQQGDARAALETLAGLLAEQPGHVPGRELLFELGLARGDLSAIDGSLPRLFDAYTRSRAHGRLCELYRDLRRSQPSYGLSDQELLLVASAAKLTQEAPLAIRAVTELLEQYPQSPLVPRALWIAAETQGEHGAREQELKTLEHILFRYPDHACALLARNLLSQREVSMSQELL